MAGGAQAQTTPQADQEIKGLLDFVERSECKFVRNGSEYPGPEARAHLEKTSQSQWKRLPSQSALADWHSGREDAAPRVVAIAQQTGLNGKTHGKYETTRPAKSPGQGDFAQRLPWN
ncbi:MAG: DUF5329 family protein [Pseudomonas sp.]